jgi:hypothetical protein
MNDVKQIKQKIINLFNQNVRNKKVVLTGNLHYGSVGHWLEGQMNIARNCKNEPDFEGFEMKKYSQKISFGDFSATEYAFTRRDRKQYISKDLQMTRSQFMSFFGKKNHEKNDRYSWSGRCVPTYDQWNLFGQLLTVEPNNDICIYYSFSLDSREEKENFPDYLKNENILIAIWKSEKMERHINRKFNQNGFFICKMKDDIFTSICFGEPFTFNQFIEGIKKRIIIFDSGMYDGNNRPYSHFRSINDTFWKTLLIEEY